MDLLDGDVIVCFDNDCGLTYLAGASFNVEGITHLGYPVYLLKILAQAPRWHRDTAGTVSDAERMGLRGLYVRPARSVSVACSLWRSLGDGLSTINHSRLRHGLVPAMEDRLEVRERA